MASRRSCRPARAPARQRLVPRARSQSSGAAGRQIVATRPPTSRGLDTVGTEVAEPTERIHFQTFFRRLPRENCAHRRERWNSGTEGGPSHQRDRSICFGRPFCGRPLPVSPSDSQPLPTLPSCPRRRCHHARRIAQRPYLEYALLGRRGRRAARRRRRAEAGAAADPLRDDADGARVHDRGPARGGQERARRRRRARALSSAWRPAACDADGANGAGLRAALCRDRSTAAALAQQRRRGGDALHRGAGWRRWRVYLLDRSTKERSDSAPTTTARPRSHSCCSTACRSCSSTAPSGIAVGLAVRPDQRRKVTAPITLLRTTASRRHARTLLPVPTIRAQPDHQRAGRRSSTAYASGTARAGARWKIEDLAPRRSAASWSPTTPPGRARGRYFEEIEELVSPKVRTSRSASGPSGCS